MSLKYRDRDIFRHVDDLIFVLCILYKKTTEQSASDEKVKQEKWRHGIESQKEEKEQLRMKTRRDPRVRAGQPTREHYNQIKVSQVSKSDASKHI